MYTSKNIIWIIKTINCDLYLKYFCNIVFILEISPFQITLSDKKAHVMICRQ